MSEQLGKEIIDKCRELVLKMEDTKIDISAVTNNGIRINVSINAEYDNEEEELEDN